MPVVGRVLALHRWPVKSLAGEAVEALRVDRRGAAGDREHALVATTERGDRRLTAQATPGLLAWSAAYGVPGAELDPHAPPEPVLTAPDGARYAWSDPALPTALAADLGLPVALARGLHRDRRDTLHLTVEGTRAAAEASLGHPLDVRRFRSNLHLELDAEPFAEEGWVGRALRVGEAELALLEPCERCVVPTRDPDTREKLPELLRWLAREHATNSGVIARARGPAVVRAGDTVELLGLAPRRRRRGARTGRPKARPARRAGRACSGRAGRRRGSVGR